MASTEDEVEVEAVMVTKKKVKMRTVHGQIFVGKMDVYECPKPYVLIFNISTEHDHVVRMDVHKADLAREMRLWLEGKQIKSPLLVIPQRIEDVMTRFVKFGKAPLQEDLIMWTASRAELLWAPEPVCVFGGIPVPDPEEVAREAAAKKEAEDKERDARTYGHIPNQFAESSAVAKKSAGYDGDTSRMQDGRFVSSREVREAFHGPDLGAQDPKVIGEYNPLDDEAADGTHGYTAGQMAALRQSREANGPANSHTLTRQLLGKSQALSQLKAKKTKGRAGATASIITPQLDSDHYRISCEITRARRDVSSAMDERRRMIEIAKERQKQSAEHYREIRAKAQENAFGWTKGATEELLTLQKIRADIEDDVRRQKNMAQRAQQKVMWTLAPAGYANRKGKSQPGVHIGPGPLPPPALYEQRDPMVEETCKHFYWDEFGRRHNRPNTAEYDDGDTAEIVHHALEAMRKAGKSLKSQKLDLKAVFDEFDSSGDGYLSMEEMAKALLSLGVKLNTQAMVALFDHFDPNKSGSVNYGEFLWAFFNRRDLARQWRRSVSRHTTKEITAKFHKADTNGDSRLTKKEFVKFLKSFGLTNYSDSEIEVLMFRFDVDGDGELDLSEFQQFMENELNVLRNSDTLKSDISPILSQTRQAIHDERHKDDRKEESKGKSKAKGKHWDHKRTQNSEKDHSHKAHALMGLELTSSEVGAEMKGSEEPEFITEALKAQAYLENKLPSSVFAKKTAK